MRSCFVRIMPVVMLGLGFVSLSGCQFAFLLKLTSADGETGDQFGNAVAIDGDTLVVGARGADIGTNGTQGAVYVFIRDGNTWVFVTKLTASDGARSDVFGSSVAIDGDTVVVGAPLADTGGHVDQGAVYVYERLATGVFPTTETQKLVASDGAVGDHFGTSVGIHGDTIVVGAALADIGSNDDQGAAYVFERLASGAFPGTESQKLVASDGAAGDRLGFAIGVCGNTIVVGAPAAQVGANVDQGAAYVFERLASGAFPGVETQKLFASDGAVGDAFAWSVAIDADTIVAGAPFADVAANDGQGAAYVFERLGTGAFPGTETQKLVSSDGDRFDQFGFSVAVDTDTIIVGASLAKIGANNNQGAAYVYERSASGTFPGAESQKLVAADGAPSDRLGEAATVNGDTAVVGARLDDVGANANQGSAYVFERGFP